VKVRDKRSNGIITMTARVCEQFYVSENDCDKFPPTRRSWQDEARTNEKIMSIQLHRRMTSLFIFSMML